MGNKLHGLKPERLWFYFNEILQVPRPSKKEENIIKYLLDFGQKYKLETLQDSIGNVIIRKPATVGKEEVKSVILQSHMDMVCEKNSDKVFNFDTDAIEAIICEDWVKANGTTLGADDGIGIAAQLAILESKDIKHGPIECLFTVDEETGLTGSFELDPNILKGETLLNLDSEDEGKLFIGCAGGKDTIIELSYEQESIPSEHTSYKIIVNGLKGGHSGDEINKGIGNANKILNRFLFNASLKYSLKLAYFDGGNLRNAIAREAFAIVLIPNDKLDTFIEESKTFKTIIQSELKITDAKVNFEIKEVEKPEFIFSAITQKQLINSLYACPHGVITYSTEIPDFVETSTNLASVKTNKDHILITTSQRSSVESAKTDVANMVASCFALTNAKVFHTDGYPGWKPKPESEIIATTVKSYKRLFNEEPEVLAIHAGLECGLIGAKYPNMDMISFGPTIKGAHSPDERLHIESTKKFWDFLIDILENI